MDLIQTLQDTRIQRTIHRTYPQDIYTDSSDTDTECALVTTRHLWHRHGTDITQEGMSNLIWGKAL